MIQKYLQPVANKICNPLRGAYATQPRVCQVMKCGVRIFLARAAFYAAQVSPVVEYGVHGHTW